MSDQPDGAGDRPADRPTDRPTDPLTAFAGGDSARARVLGDALRVLRDRSDDDTFRRSVDDVLAGRRSVRDLSRSPGFAAAVTPAVEGLARRWEEMDEDERQRLADRGEAALRDETPGEPAAPAD